jgi:WD40 repeat protein
MYSPNDSQILYFDVNGIKLIDAQEGKEIRTFDSIFFKIICISFSPDGTKVAAGYRDTISGWIKLWDIKTGKLIKTYTGHNGDVPSISFAPDGKSIASGSYDGTIKIWKIPEDSEVNGNKSDNKKLMLNIFPNPANDKLSFSYNLTSDKIVSFSIFDILGNEVQTISNTQRYAGQNDETIELNSLPQGVYYLKLSAGSDASGCIFSVIR